jgi:hypothetical protein
VARRHYLQVAEGLATACRRPVTPGDRGRVLVAATLPPVAGKDQGARQLGRQRMSAAAPQPGINENEPAAGPTCLPAGNRAQQGIPGPAGGAMFVWLIDMERLTFEIRKVVVYSCVRATEVAIIVGITGGEV